MRKYFNVIRTSEAYGSSLGRRICVDTDPDNSRLIRDYLFANREKFLKVVEKILTMPNIYSDRFKREYTGGKWPVSAIRFSDAGNTRIYCQERKDEQGHFFIICAVRFHKKTKRNDKKILPILENIANYDYQYKP